MARQRSVLAEAFSDRFHWWLFHEAATRGFAPKRAYSSPGLRPPLERGSKARLLRAMDFDKPQQFDRYLEPGGPIPGKVTLRKICDAMGLSWPAAALMAGYVDEFFAIAQRLCDLGLSWCETDGLKFELRRGVELGRLTLRPGVRERYVLINEYDAELNSAPRSFNHHIGVPNPTASAILLLRAYFSRMWETLRPGREGYWQSVLREITPMIAIAESRLDRTPGRRALHPLLRRALATLSDPLVRSRSRWMAAEYVDLWAHEISAPFARYVGHALYHEPTLASRVLNPDVSPLPEAGDLARGVREDDLTLT